MKNIIIGIIIGGIVFTLGGVVATTAISSTNVTYQNKTVNNALDELYDEAVTGKELVAAAITNKGINTTSNDTYEVMASNINNIDTDHTEINQKISNLESKHNSDIASLTGSISNLNQSLTQLNEEKKLKLLGSANSNTYIDISKYINEYSELIISVTLGNTPYRITINIPPAELVDSDITYQSGSRASASIGTVVNVQCSRKRVLLTAVIVNDNDVLAYSTIRIYGRK